MAVCCSAACWGQPQQAGIGRARILGRTQFLYVPLSKFFAISFRKQKFTKFLTILQMKKYRPCYAEQLG